MKQYTNKYNKKEVKSFQQALEFIGERKVYGPGEIPTEKFTNRAKLLQEQFHSTISILKHLRSKKEILPNSSLKKLKK